MRFYLQKYWHCFCWIILLPTIYHLGYSNELSHISVRQNHRTTKFIRIVLLISVQSNLVLFSRFLRIIPKILMPIREDVPIKSSTFYLLLNIFWKFMAKVMIWRSLPRRNQSLESRNKVSTIVVNMSFGVG